MPEEPASPVALRPQFVMQQCRGWPACHGFCHHKTITGTVVLSGPPHPSAAPTKHSESFMGLRLFPLDPFAGIRPGADRHAAWSGPCRMATPSSSVHREADPVAAGRAAAHEIRDGRQRNRELRSSPRGSAYEPPPPASQPAPIMPQIPSGYALVPCGARHQQRRIALAGQASSSRRSCPRAPSRSARSTSSSAASSKAAGYYRSRNQVTDLASSFNGGIPLRNSPLYHEPQSGF